MAFISAFDVLGPNMIGPSSSHTAGAVAIGLLAQKMINGPIRSVTFTLYGSFAKTYWGHGTDRALLGGIMGFQTDDERIRDSFAIAKDRGIEFSFIPNLIETDTHPNTVDIRMENGQQEVMTVRGESLGGGKVRIVRINQVEVDFTGEYSAVIVVHKDRPGVIAHITKCLTNCNVNIAFLKLFREDKGATAYSIIESDEKLPLQVIDAINENQNVYNTMLVQDQAEDETTAPNQTSHIDKSENLIQDFKHAEDLLKLCQKENLSISEVMIRREDTYSDSDRAVIIEKMKRALRIMKDSAHKPLITPVKSMGGLIGGESAKLKKRYDSGASICGNTLGKAVMYSMAVLEVNASMGLIVAAPTAGSSGIVPGLLLALQEEYDRTDEHMIQALFTASAIGYLAMRNATVAGAVGGCQAEVGVASAMASAAAVELMGGTPAQALDAASTTLSNLLGLVCDPIAGLVESPCQNRNSIGVANALTCAEMALAGIKQLIPFDEMLETMYHVGRGLPAELRETALGGCAATKTACRLACGGCE